MYSDLSKRLTNKLKKDVKKREGIFFTPPSTIYHNLKNLDKYMDDIKTALEPSCGSCEYICALNELYPHIKITGIEKNETIYNEIDENDIDENVTIYNDDYLTRRRRGGYDLIIGNPPYFVMKNDDVGPNFKKYFDGRPNIFILFIIKALVVDLNEDGILSFVLPKSFLNCIYYNKTRKFINKNYTILDIVEYDDAYLETKQETIIINIKKCKPTNNDTFTMMVGGGNIIFGTPKNIKTFNKLCENSTTLHQLGFRVKIGGVVWNQHKDKLTDDATKTRLIYNSDIVDNKLSIKKYKNVEKKNYIEMEGVVGPLLVVNRGYGGVGTYKFDYCVVDIDTPYLVENHLICLEHEDEDIIAAVVKSFGDERTARFIKLYFGNNALNTVELANNIPIYLSLV